MTLSMAQKRCITLLIEADSVLEKASFIGRKVQQARGQACAAFAVPATPANTLAALLGPSRTRPLGSKELPCCGPIAGDSIAVGCGKAASPCSISDAKAIAAGCSPVPLANMPLPSATTTPCSTSCALSSSGVMRSRHLQVSGAACCRAHQPSREVCELNSLPALRSPAPPGQVGLTQLLDNSQVYQAAPTGLRSQPPAAQGCHLS